MTWLRHADPQASGAGAVLAGPGTEPVRSARRVNAVLTAVHGMVPHAAATGQAPAHLVPVLYEVAAGLGLARTAEEAAAQALEARPLQAGHRRYLAG